MGDGLSHVSEELPGPALTLQLLHVNEGAVGGISRGKTKVPLVGTEDVIRGLTEEIGTVADDAPIEGQEQHPAHLSHLIHVGFCGHHQNTTTRPLPPRAPAAPVPV